MSDQLTQTTRLDSLSHIQELKSRVEAAPQNELYRFSLAKALFDLGRFTEARDHLEFAIQKNPAWMAASVLLGKVYQQTGDFDRAKNCYTRAAELALDQGHETAREEILVLLRALGS